MASYKFQFVLPTFYFDNLPEGYFNLKVTKSIEKVVVIAIFITSSFQFN
jgi:hypothetical protein